MKEGRIGILREERRGELFLESGATQCRSRRLRKRREFVETGVMG